MIFLLLTSCLTVIGLVDHEPVLSDMKTQQTLTYLALGDSYTIGESVKESERWPVQLVKSAREKGYQISDPKIIATTGWTTNELQEGIEKANISEVNYDYVSLLIGVNNQYRNYSFEQFEREFRQLLNYAIAKAGGMPSRVFVVSIPDYGVTPFGQSREPEKIAVELDRYNAFQKYVCDQEGVPFYDITPISKEAKDQSDLVADDTLHPSGKMYSRWVDEVILEGFLTQLGN